MIPIVGDKVRFIEDNKEYVGIVTQYHKNYECSDGVTIWVASEKMEFCIDYDCCVVISKGVNQHKVGELVSLIYRGSLCLGKILETRIEEDNFYAIIQVGQDYHVKRKYGDFFKSGQEDLKCRND
jgi:hypothetical protein